MNKVNNILMILLMSTLSLWSADMSDEMKKQNQKVVTLFVQEMSDQLPQKIDRFTTLKEIKGETQRIDYIFEINIGSKSDAQVIKEDHSRMKEAVTLGICKTSIRFLEAEIAIRYIYLSAQSHKELFHFDVSQADCLKER